MVFEILGKRDMFVVSPFLGLISLVRGAQIDTFDYTPYRKYDTDWRLELPNYDKEIWISDRVSAALAQIVTDANFAIVHDS